MSKAKTAAELNHEALKHLEFQPDQALEVAIRALDAARCEENKLQEADALRHVGSAYWAFYEYDLALEYYFKALKLSSEIGYKPGIAGVHNNLSLVYSKLEYIDEAQKHLELALVNYRELGPENDLALAAVNNNLGKLHELRGEYKQALACHYETLRISQQKQYKPGVLRAKLNIGVVHGKTNDYIAAEQFYSEACDLTVELKFDRERVNVLFNRIRNYSLGGRCDEAAEQLEVMRSLLDEMDFPPGELTFHNAMALYHRALADKLRDSGDFEQAMREYEITCDEQSTVSVLKAKTFNSELTDKVARLQSLFEIERKQHESQVAQQNAEIYRLENIELVKRQKELETALQDIKQLQGLLPICSHCKKIRDDSGFWTQVEEYIAAHSEAQFTHSLCPSCMRDLYPDVHKEIMENGEYEDAD